MSDVSSKDLRLGAAKYLCELIRCAFSEELVPGELPEGVKLSHVYAVAKHNSVESMAFYGLRKRDFSDDAELAAKWKSSVDTALFRQAYFDTEREGIIDEMEKEGLSYLPLKGIRLAALYPMPGMRSMADNDILYGIVEKDPSGGYRVSDDSVPEAQSRLSKIMTGRGYTLSEVSSNHDAYSKKPFYNFEMHRDLVPEHEYCFEYYRDPWKRAVAAEGHGYFFSSEDDYIYNIAHMYMHYNGGGCGVRHIADMLVVHDNMGDSLDMEYIGKELDKLGIREFHDKMYDFMKAVLLDGAELSAEQEELLLILTGCGTYGSRERLLENRLNDACRKGSKLSYIRQRLFPDKETIKRKYPKFYGKPYLMPVLFVYRGFRGIAFGGSRLWKEFKALLRHK
ncbi:MAG: hypothetical protein E7578_02545 [Ruminococcaceae bacterium]|nr:hypothetical protein [Oscillospiraceae bacterium]